MCDLTGVRPYDLRFWEKNFDTITPLIDSTGQKCYEKKDIKAILFIKDCLARKMTFEEIKSLNPLKDSSLEKIHFSFDREKLMGAREHLKKLLEMTQSLKNRY